MNTRIHVYFQCLISLAKAIAKQVLVRVLATIVLVIIMRPIIPDELPSTNEIGSCFVTNNIHLDSCRL